MPHRATGGSADDLGTGWMHPVYFDETASAGYRHGDLEIPGSLRGVEPIALNVLLYDNESLEVEAVLEFEPSYQRWMARPLWDTVKHVDPKHALA